MDIFFIVAMISMVGIVGYFFGQLIWMNHKEKKEDKEMLLREQPEVSRLIDLIKCESNTLTLNHESEISGVGRDDCYLIKLSNISIKINNRFVLIGMGSVVDDYWLTINGHRSNLSSKSCEKVFEFVSEIDSNICLKKLEQVMEV